jgi:acetylornithine deacetylase
VSEPTPKTTATDHGQPPIDPTRLRRLLRRLIEIYSPSGKEEDVLEFVRGWLKRRGIPVERQEVDERRYNLVVPPPPGVSPRLAFIGHLDTVTHWDLENLGEYQEDGDQVAGLGAADMKGGCAAMLEAVAALYSQEGPRPPVALALVVGEEEDGDGAEALAQEMHFPWAVIGEPTDLMPCLEHHGYLEMEINARGRRRHASLSSPADNPVREVLRLLMAVVNHLDNHHTEVVYNIRDIQSWPEGFIVPEGCQAWVDMHLPPRTPLGEITMELEEAVFDQQDRASHLEMGLRLHTIQNGYRLPERGPVVETLQAIYSELELEWRPQAFPSHSDANQLWAAGIRPILLGPGRLEMAHTPDESVSFSQVLAAARIYYELARRTLA